MLLLKIDSSVCLCAAAALTSGFIYLGFVYSSEDKCESSNQSSALPLPFITGAECLLASAASVCAHFESYNCRGVFLGCVFPLHTPLSINNKYLLSPNLNTPL